MLICVKLNFNICIYAYRDWNDATLQICLRWLLRQCGRPQTECRHTCMKLVYNLATSLPGNGRYRNILGNIMHRYRSFSKLLFFCLSGVKTPVDLFSALIKDDNKYFLQR